MAIDKNCMYCMRDSRVSDLMFEIAELKVSTFYFLQGTDTSRKMHTCI